MRGTRVRHILRRRCLLCRRHMCTPPPPKSALHVLPTPNPDSLKFTTQPGDSPSKDASPGAADVNESMGIREGGIAFYDTACEVPSSHAWVRSLWSVDGVSGVMVGPGYVAVNKKSEYAWTEVQPCVEDVLQSHVASGGLLEAPVRDSADDDGASVDEVTAEVRRVLDERVAPAVREDGGNVELIGVREGVAFVRMQGSCAGCPSSSLTLRSLVQRVVTHYVPSVMAVMAVTHEDLDRMGLTDLIPVKE